MDAFISHASQDTALAKRLENELEARGLEVWVDTSELGLGVLLGPELQRSIRDSRALILLWSEPAAASRWVNTEWLSAFHQDKFIVPCVIDGTPLPQCLRNAVYLDLRRAADDAGALERLARTIRNARTGAAARMAPVIRSEAPEVKKAIRDIAALQQEMTAFLDRRNPAAAEEVQLGLDGVMAQAEKIWPLEPMIVNLGGYHLKNAYMLRHWDAVQAGRAPEDPLLEQAERKFFEALSLDPTDPSALNGLGSILIFRRDLHAAESFILWGIAWAKQRGISYAAAERDLAMVRRFKGP